MTPESVMILGTEAIKTALLLAAPLLLTALVSGLLISLLQAATQLNEMTLSFIPKVLAVSTVLISLGPWMLSTMIDYMQSMFSRLPMIVG